jgi:hypothetical protein
MKLLYIIFVVAVIMALTTQPEKESEADKEIKHSEELADSASIVLDEMHKINDSLMIQKYFYEAK